MNTDRKCLRYTKRLREGIKGSVKVESVTAEGSTRPNLRTGLGRRMELPKLTECRHPVLDEHLLGITALVTIGQQVCVCVCVFVWVYV